MKMKYSVSTTEQTVEELMEEITRQAKQNARIAEGYRQALMQIYTKYQNNPEIVQIVCRAFNIEVK